MTQWFKSTYSGGDNNCVEVAHNPEFDRPWRKASYSQSEAACVEVADIESGSAIRDTKYRELGVLFFPAAEWQAFLGTARNGLP